MKLLIDHAQKRSVNSLFDDGVARLPVLQAGSAEPATISKLTRIEYPYEARLFTPDDLSQITFRVALGAGFIAPVGGTFTLTGTGGTTSPIDYNATCFEIEAALNAVLTNPVVVNGASGLFFIS